MNKLVSGVSSNVDPHCNYSALSGGGSSCNPPPITACAWSDNDPWAVKQKNCSNEVGFQLNENTVVAGSDGKNNYNPTGIHVIGKNCIGLGLFVEHQTCWPIIWDGDNGTLVFSQGECAYYHMNVGCSASDSPYPSGYYYTIGSNVKTHFYTGGGIYAIFNNKAYPAAINIEKANTTGITINNLVVGAWAGKAGFQSAITLKEQKLTGTAGKPIAANQKIRIFNLNNESYYL